MNALSSTFAEATRAIRAAVDMNTPDSRGATFASVPRAFRVIDEDTGECVGSVRPWPNQHPFNVEWKCGGRGDYAETMEAALGEIEAETILRRSFAA